MESNEIDDETGGIILATYEYADGSLYEGEWNQLGEKHGYGIYRLPSGECYQGRFEKGLPSGLGRLKFPDGALYAGEFMQGWFHGYGLFQLPSGAKFEGQFRGGKIWGLGLTTFSDGSHGFPRREGWHKDWLFAKKQKCEEIIYTVRNNASFLDLAVRSSPTHECDEHTEFEEKLE